MLYLPGHTLHFNLILYRSQLSHLPLLQPTNQQAVINQSFCMCALLDVQGNSQTQGEHVNLTQKGSRNAYELSFE